MQKPPVEVVHLFPLLDELLIKLLRSLTMEEWHAPTVAGRWRVKDVAAHLLDTNMRAKSLADRYAGDPPGQIASYRELVNYLNQLNADWVQAMKRVSPAQLTDLLESTGKAYCEIMASAALFEPAPFSVAWAGEETSLNWFHIAREYTEKWHHQMQIRDAVGQTEPLFQRELYYPCMDTFMYGLPHALRQLQPAENTVVQVSITGDMGGDWFAAFKGNSWHLSKNEQDGVRAKVQLDPDMAWKLFTKGISPDKARESAILEGDPAMCNAVLQMISVMA